MTRKLATAAVSSSTTTTKESESKTVEANNITNQNPNSMKTSMAPKCRIITSFEELGNLKARSRLPIDIHLVTNPTCNENNTDTSSSIMATATRNNDVVSTEECCLYQQQESAAGLMSPNSTLRPATRPVLTSSNSINFSSLIAVSKDSHQSTSSSNSASSSSSTSPNPTSANFPKNTTTNNVVAEQPVKYFSFMTTNKLFSNYTSQSTLKHQHQNQHQHHQTSTLTYQHHNHNHNHHHSHNQKPQETSPITPPVVAQPSPKQCSNSPKEASKELNNDESVNVISCSLSTSSSNSSGVDSGCCSSSLARSSILSSQSSDYSTSSSSHHHNITAVNVEVERAETASTNSAASCSFSSDGGKAPIQDEQQLNVELEKERVKTLCEKIYSSNSSSSSSSSSKSSSKSIMMIANLTTTTKTQETNSLDRVKSKQSMANAYSKRSDKILTVLFDYEPPQTPTTTASVKKQPVFAVKQGEQVKVIRDYDETYYLVAAISTGRIGFIPKDYTVDLKEIRKRVKQQQEQLETTPTTKNTCPPLYQSTMKAGQCSKLTKL